MHLNLQVWQQRLFPAITDITQITFWLWNPYSFCGFFSAIFSISIYENVHIDSSLKYFYNGFIGKSKSKIAMNLILDWFPAPKQAYFKKDQHQIKIRDLSEISRGEGGGWNQGEGHIFFSSQKGEGQKELRAYQGEGQKKTCQFFIWY